MKSITHAGTAKKRKKRTGIKVTGSIVGILQHVCHVIWLLFDIDISLS